MLPFLRKNHYVPIPYFQQLHMRDDIIKKQVCVQPLALTAHRQWGKPSASFFHSSFSLSQLQGDIFCHDLLQGQAALKGKSVGSYIPPLIMPALKIRMLQDKLVQMEPSAQCPLTHTAAPRWPNPKLHRKLETLQLAPRSWSAISSAGLHY